MGKYDPLRHLLARQPGSSVRLSFADIESALDEILPYSARAYREWWANETVGSHVQARSWLSAGWKVEAVDLERGIVAFVRR